MARMTADPHPGFGLFAKAHHEFFDALEEDGWTPVEGYQGVRTKLLSGRFDHRARTGAETRLSRWDPGAAVDHPVCHTWCEEVMVVSGSMAIGRPGAVEAELQAGAYAVRPAGIEHGPFFSEKGCVLIEFLYYPPQT